MADRWQFFNSTDTGAPSMTGLAGSGVSVLDAVLVNGYNSRSGVTLTRSGTTVTATFTAHGYAVGRHVTIAGATETDYNGVWRITSATANTFTFEITGSPTTPATGTITSIVTPLGYTIEYTATNRRVYRAPDGTRFYLDANDDGALVTTAGRGMVMRGYETMTAVGTGTNPFPLPASVADASCIWVKSDTASSATRAWTIWGDGKTFHMNIRHTASSGDVYSFGDFESVVPGDTLYNCALGIRNSTDVSTGFFTYSASMAIGAAQAAGGQPGWYSPRGLNGTLASRMALVKQAFTNSGIGAGNNSTTSTGTAPDSVTSKLLASPLVLFDYCATTSVNAASRPRGYMRGLLELLHGVNSYGSVALGDEMVCTPLSATAKYRIDMASSAGLTSTNPHILAQVAGPAITLA